MNKELRCVYRDGFGFCELFSESDKKSNSTIHANKEGLCTCKGLRCKTYCNGFEKSWDEAFDQRGSEHAER